MADYRQDNRDRPNASGRDSSIFSTSDRTDRWREDYQRWSSSGAARGSQPAGASDYRSNSGHSSSDDRGFFDRAGDEVRSWFGDEEAERRREADARRYEQEHGTSGRYQGGGHEDQWTGGAPDPRSSRDRMGSGYGQSGGYGQDRPQGGYGASSAGGSRTSGLRHPAGGQSAGQSAQSYGGGQQGDHYGERNQRPQSQSYGQAGTSMGGYGQSSPGQSSPGQSGFGQSGFGQSSLGQQDRSTAQSAAAHDEAYRRWREQQIQALDQEYQEYCQHRQHQFEQDFSSFRQSRRSGVTSGGPTMGHSGAPRGSTELASSSGATQGTGAQAPGQTGGQNAAATTTGGGTASAMKSSVGSTGMAAETGNQLTGAGTAAGKSRKGRS